MKKLLIIAFLALTVTACQDDPIEFDVLENTAPDIIGRWERVDDCSNDYLAATFLDDGTGVMVFGTDCRESLISFDYSRFGFDVTITLQRQPICESFGIGSRVITWEITHNKTPDDITINQGSEGGCSYLQFTRVD